MGGLAGCLGRMGSNRMKMKMRIRMKMKMKMGCLLGFG